MKSTRFAGTIIGLILGSGLFLFAFHNNPSLMEALVLTPESLHFSKAHQLWTGHWFHWGKSHLIWDLIAWGIFAGCLEWQVRTKGLLLRTACISPVLSVVLIWLYPDIHAYAGLSGLVCALLGSIVWRAVLNGNGKTAIWWTLLFLGKFIVETHGDSGGIFAGELGVGIASFPPAHLAGFLLGALFEVCLETVVWHRPMNRRKFHPERRESYPDL